MFTLLFLVLVIVISSTLLLYPYVKLSWLQAVAGAIIISLPFERIPSVNIAGGTLRISQILTALGIYLFLILFIKKDKSLMKMNLHNKSIWIFLFFLVSLPSTLFVISGTRYLITMVATTLSFGALFLVSNFTKNLKQKVFYLCLAFMLVTVFALYQIVGDLIGLPGTLTGLKPMFSSFIFGIPRVHTTFNEPSYFANSLFLFISLFFFWSVLEVNIFKVSAVKKASNFLQKIALHLQNSKVIQWCHKNYQLFYHISISTFIVLFLFTLSKSAWVIAPVLIVYCLYFGRKYNMHYFTKFFISLGISILVLTGILLIFSKEARETVNNIYTHLMATVTRDSATAMERSFNAQTALVDLYPQRAITGIGSGQFGSYARDYLLSGLSTITKPEEIIVFNVYIEVLLEFGLLAVCVFLYIFLHSLWANHQQIRIKDKELFENDNEITTVSETKRYYLALRLALGGAILMFMLQWNFISPIYINPIFISLGILLNIDQDKLLYYED